VSAVTVVVAVPPAGTVRLVAATENVSDSSVSVRARVTGAVPPLR
jgi:hypothetical protein